MVGRGGNAPPKSEDGGFTGRSNILSATCRLKSTGPDGGTRTRTSMIKSQPYCQLILRPEFRFRYFSERFRLFMLMAIFLFKLLMKWYFHPKLPRDMDVKSVWSSS